MTALRHRRRKRSEVVWHESYFLDDQDVTEIDAIPVTTPTRTVLDLAAVLDRDGLLRVFDDAIRRHLSSVEVLLRAHGLPIPSRQFPVVAPNGARMRIDFAYEHYTIGMEVLGAAHHATPGWWDDNLDRIATLNALGWDMRLFTYSQVRDRPQVVAAAVRTALVRAGHCFA